MARDKLDRYYTPDAVARACVDVLPESWLSFGGWDPHCGGGAFVRAMVARGFLWSHGSDIDPAAPAAGRSAAVDFLDACPTSADCIIGNPPYRQAEAHCRHALRGSRRVAFLLRLALLEGQRRRAFWQEYPPSKVWVLPKRPSFTGGATDATAYGFFVWDPADWGAKRFDWLPGEW